MNGELKWVSLSVSFLSDMKIKRIRKLPDGDKIVLVWIGLICLAAKTNDKGFIYLDKETPYDEELLTSEFDISIELLRLAIAVFKKYNMISVDESGMIFINNYLKYNEKAERLGDIREKARLRVAAFRDRQRLMPKREESTKEEKNKYITLHNTTGNANSNVTETLQTSPAASDLDSEFQEWYKDYPRKIGRGNALRNYKSARKKASQQQLLDGLKRYVVECKGKEVAFIAHPATWLNGERWLDEHAPFYKKSETVNPDAVAQRRLFEQYRQKNQSQMSINDFLPSTISPL